ncbi:alcohol dehydrogenase catalytic domain-containing protein [Natronolimnohabitans innermongolicus]|uniref:Zinc-containing alcohol dehydrogenase n=1 Tax=Natronolimnohabitans innermongolicus JCM 12255 TaxID=1227499 RepID=L9WNB9_9EURY|nr:alcohol dehydrogenase catalytic domain-containing protein [Natronolimnohabitans innermongolicus]ELY50887.1 zinc-containing alcohol dehydrogenase [Natronolimnohabitans innermongolicus JCM 12255]
MREITAAVAREPESHAVERVTLEDPEPDEVLVDVRATGVCHTDYHAYTSERTSFPVVLGHEGAGVVEAVGDAVTTVEPGDHVVLWVLPSCGDCQYCRRGEPYLCQARKETRGRMPDGSRRLSRADEPIDHFYAQSSFASMSVVPERQVVPVDEKLPFEIGALLGCGVPTGLGAVTNIADVEHGETVAVFGCGGVGAGAILAANAVSAGEIIAVDLDAETLATMDAIGATKTIDASATDPVAAIDDSVGAVDYAFECIGAPPTVTQAIEVLGPGGTAVITGTSDSDPVDLDLGLFTSGIEVVGNIVGFTRPHVDIPRYVTMYQNGDLDLDTILTGRYELEELDEAFDALETGEGIRSVVRFDPGP